MTSERPAKRVRQACEPCRRKKSKCPGEKPACSLCSRLRQHCHYANEDQIRENNFSRTVASPFRLPPGPPSVSPQQEPRLEDRVRFLEAQLSQVVAGQIPFPSHQSPSSNFVQSPQQPIPQVNVVPQSQLSENSGLPPWETINAAGEAYLLYCDSQPIPLFHRQSFLQSLGQRDEEVIFAILALALRFTDPATLGRSDEEIASYVERSRKIVSKKVFAGTVELSTIQSLCLLSLVDFTDGNTRRASIHSSLAMNLAHNAELTSETYGSLDAIEREERRRCFWSLFLIKRLHGADFSILDFTGEENFPYYPSTPDRPLDSDEQPHSSDDGADGKGIIAYALQLSQVWFKITKYARRRGKPSTLPPWSPQSEYSTILAEQMDFETRMPPIHRFRPAKFSHRSIQELNSNRDYWGPWLFLQIVYHTNILLLNHPLLFSLRLRNFKSMIPEIFLQHTSDMISSHASWIIHILDMLQRKDFKVTDPFLAYCVAIVATIYLQESAVDDPETRNEKKDNFHKCLDFVRGMGEQWPHVSRIAQKLSSLSETVSASYTVSSSSTTTTTNTANSSAPPQPPTRSLLIDLSLFWEILEYSSASEVPGSARQLFGPTLYSGASLRRGFAHEMAQTSPLPEPTRVDRREYGSRGGSPGRSTIPLQERNVGDGMRVENTGIVSATDTQLGTPFVYSDEELAVLAESFFSQQRGDFDANMSNDWWNTGNL